MKRQYVVRIALTDQQRDKDFANPFLECLRYAGLVTVHNEKFFDIHCPKGLDSQTWSDMNARRMQTFGYNAVQAPAWDRGPRPQ